MNLKKTNLILIGMIFGSIIGVVGGLWAGEFFIGGKFIGTIFLNALRMVVVPLIVASIVVGVATLGDIRKLGPTTLKTMLYYLLTTGIAVCIGLVLVNLINPGVGVERIGAYVPDIVAKSQNKSFLDVLVSMVPANLFQAAAENQVLGLIVFSLLFGGVLTTIGEKGKAVIAFFEGLNQAIMKLVHVIIIFAPLGVMMLIGGIVAENRDSVKQLASGMGWYSLTVLLGLVIHAVLVLPLLLKFLGKRDPWRYISNLGEALATAFTTASSSATLPITMECVEEKNGIDRRVSSFVLPLGATINMDGTALYEAVAAMFIAQVYGIDLTLAEQVTVFLTATLASIGAAGIPHAGTVTMVFVLSSVGLPIEGIGLIWAIDWLLDRFRTTVNVFGDTVGAAVIAQTKEFAEGK